MQDALCFRMYLSKTNLPARIRLRPLQKTSPGLPQNCHGPMVMLKHNGRLRFSRWEPDCQQEAAYSSIPIRTLRKIWILQQDTNIMYALIATRHTKASGSGRLISRLYVRHSTRRIAKVLMIPIPIPKNSAGPSIMPMKMRHYGPWKHNIRQSGQVLHGLTQRQALTII